MEISLERVMEITGGLAFFISKLFLFFEKRESYSTLAKTYYIKQWLWMDILAYPFL